MNIRNIVLSVLILFTFMIPSAYAQEENCPHDEQLRLREIVGKLSFSYELETYEGARLYNVYISGFTKDIYALEEGANVIFVYNGTGVSDWYGFTPGTIRKLVFYASEESVCPNFKIMTHNIAIPHYNYYSEHPLCVGIENYALCQRNSSIYKDIKSYDQFELLLNTYLKSLEDGDVIPEPPINGDQDKTILGVILNFLGTYYMPILIGVIILASSGIVYLEFKRRKEIL